MTANLYKYLEITIAFPMAMLNMAKPSSNTENSNRNSTTIDTHKLKYSVEHTSNYGKSSPWMYSKENKNKKSK